MSHGNVEIVRRASEAVFRRPVPDWATINALYHPEHENVYVAWLEGEEAKHGAQGFRALLASLDATWATYGWETDDVSEVDADRVLVMATFVGRARRGGPEVPQRLAILVTVRDGKIVRTETFYSSDEALRAAAHAAAR